MGSKKFRMFAGPNGSGKSTLITQIDRQYKLGYKVNADVIQDILNRKNFLDCQSILPQVIEQKDWLDFINQNQDDPRLKGFSAEMLFVKENVLVTKGTVDSYQAAFVASFFRELLLRENSTFSFETVMSHPSKIDFMKRAKDAGFKTYLYFICTRDPEINKERVSNRKQKGGHSVENSKIEKRYYRSLNLLFDAFQIADRVYVLDNSTKKRSVILEKKAKKIEIYEDQIPEWIGQYILDKL